MTSAEFEKNRFEIVRDYLKFFTIFDADDLGVSVSCSTDGLYHVFIRADGQLIHQYSVTDGGLKKIAANLKLSTIKKLFIDSRLKSLENKMIDREKIFNPLDFENQS